MLQGRLSPVNPYLTRQSPLCALIYYSKKYTIYPEYSQYDPKMAKILAPHFLKCEERSLFLKLF